MSCESSRIQCWKGFLAREFLRPVSIHIFSMTDWFTNSQLSALRIRAVSGVRLCNLVLASLQRGASFENI